MMVYNGPCGNFGHELFYGSGFDTFYLYQGGFQVHTYNRSDGLQVGTSLVSMPNPALITPNKEWIWYRPPSTGTTLVPLKIEKRTFGGTLLWEYEDPEITNTPTQTNPLQIAVCRSVRIDSTLNVYFAGCMMERHPSQVSDVVNIRVGRLDKNGNLTMQADTALTTADSGGYRYYGYCAHDVCPLLNGNVHITGSVYRELSGNFSQKRFEWQVDSDGNTVWEDIRDPGIPGSYQGQTGRYCVSDRGNNVHISYDFKSFSIDPQDDFMEIVGYDPSGNILYEYLNPGAPGTGNTLAGEGGISPRQIEVWEGKLYAIGTGGIHRYSGEWWTTRDWTRAMAGTGGIAAANFQLGYDGDVYSMERNAFPQQTFSFRRRIAANDGSVVFSHSNGFSSSATGPYVLPGVAPFFI